MMKFLSLLIALIVFSSNAFGAKCTSIAQYNSDCKKPVLDDGQIKFVNFCADGEECIDGKCCPRGTKPSGYDKHSGQISGTDGDSLTCRCPDNTYYASKDNTCYACPGEHSVWGKTDYGYSPFGEQYYDDVYKEGCICEGDMYYDTKSGECIAMCDDPAVVQFSRKGECCHPEETSHHDSGCLCTVDYLKYKYDNYGDGWENSEPKKKLDSGSLLVGANDGLVRTPPGGHPGTCVQDQCTGGALFCALPLMGHCCPCADLQDEDGLFVNNWPETCDYCPKGYIGVQNWDRKPGEKVGAFLKNKVGKVYNDLAGTCVECADYEGVWYPGSDDPNLDAYTMESYCVFCPVGTSTDGKGGSYEPAPECRCPYEGQEYIDDEEPGCFCPPGTYLYLNESEGKCSPCGNSDGSDSNLYSNSYNNEKECLKCEGKKALAIRTGRWEGNDDCVTCYSKYKAEKPVWYESKCVPCAEDPNSGGEVWSDTSTANAENGSCISCFAKNYLKPFWNGTECDECPEETPLWSTTASGCVSCYEYHQDISKAYWNPSAFDYGRCPVREGDGTLDCCAYCYNQTDGYNQTYDVETGKCIDCNVSKACKDCIDEGKDPSTCPCVPNNVDSEKLGTCMDCQRYCPASGNGEIGVLVNGTCSCQKCYDSKACKDCIAGGKNPRECPCVPNDVDSEKLGTCMSCVDYCSASEEGGEFAVLDENGTCYCQNNCPVGSVLNSGRCIADSSTCPEGYWNSTVGCCWDPTMNDCMVGSCPGSTYWDGNCCWDQEKGMCV